MLESLNVTRSTFVLLLNELFMLVLLFILVMLIFNLEQASIVGIKKYI